MSNQLWCPKGHCNNYSLSTDKPRYCSKCGVSLTPIGLTAAAASNKNTITTTRVTSVEPIKTTYENVDFSDCIDLQESDSSYKMLDILSDQMKELIKKQKEQG